ncbi:TPA: 30S ribosomal protein S9 [Candidatus Woesearchaeota archaeon]|nr:30S ribosomal protein S9 [Candidatus Woesearchaeota archaeon]
MTKQIHFSGKRKRAVARATLSPGTGRVRINEVLLDAYQPPMAKLKIMEPLILAGDLATQVDVDINVFGGGINAQTEAARLALSKCLVEMNKKLEKPFLQYDRHMLVADVRRKETRKPNDSRARAKRQKSYR